MKCKLVLIFILPFIYLSNLFSSDNDELIDLVRSGHRSARQSIRTFQCEYLIKEKLPTNNVMASGKYLRTTEASLIQDGNVGKSTEDVLVKGGYAKRVGRMWQETGNVNHFAAIESETQFFCWGDVWQRMLIDHSSPEGERCNYDVVLDRISKSAKVSKERVNGVDCIRIEIEEQTKLGHRKVLKMWHDIGNNYFIRKMESYDASNPADKNIAEIEEFMTPTQGLTFPLKCRVDTYRKGILVKGYDVLLANVTINQPIPTSVFVLPAIPTGTQLNDSLNGTIGTVGADWKPTGTMRRSPKTTLAPQKAESNGIPEVLSSQTSSEQWSITTYLLYASIAIFIGCVLVIGYRKVLTRRSQE